MKTGNLIVTAAVLATALAVGGGEAFARGGAGAGGNPSAGQRGQAGQGVATQVRPEGSQRRDGSFLNSGVTANGATSRPERGQGVRDGSRLNVPVVPPAQ